MRSFDESLPMSLLRAREATMRLFRPVLAEHGLTEQQWRVLRALVAADHPLEVGELQRRTSLLAPSVSRILAKLVELGYIERSVADHDHRRALVELTAAGTEKVAAIAPVSETAYERIEAAFGRDRLRRLQQELQDLALIEIEWSA